MKTEWSNICNGKQRITKFYFADVQMFRLIKVSYSKQIAVDYKSTHLKKKMKSKSTSSIIKKLMTFNFFIAGAIETIFVSNLTMKEEDIYRLLNERLKKTDKIQMTL